MMHIGKRTFDIPLFVGCFLSLIFTLLGAIGCVVWKSQITDFLSGGATWSKAQGTVLSSAIATAPSRKGRISYRPIIEVQLDDGAIVKGFDLTNLWSTRAPWMDRVIERYPAGARIEVMLSPRDPGRMAVERGSLAGGLTLCIPVLFLALGLAGMTLTLFRGVWIAKGRPSGGLWRLAPSSALFELLFERGYYLWIALFVAVFLGVIGGLAYFGATSGNYILVVVAAVFAYGFWKAVFPFFKNLKRSSGKQSGRKQKRRK